MRLILSEKIKKKMMALVVYDFYVFFKIDLSSVYNFTASLMIDDNINSFSSTIQFNSRNTSPKIIFEFTFFTQSFN